MPKHDLVTISGRIAHVFAHRFTLEAADGRVLLADLGPKGAEAFPLEAGVEVALEGEVRPSEIKVTRIGRLGAVAVAIEHQKKPEPGHHGPHRHQPHEHAEPAVAIAAVRVAGLDPLGSPAASLSTSKSWRGKTAASSNAMSTWMAASARRSRWSATITSGSRRSDRPPSLDGHVS